MPKSKCTARPHSKARLELFSLLAKAGERLRSNKDCSFFLILSNGMVITPQISVIDSAIKSGLLKFHGDELVVTAAGKELIALLARGEK